MKLFKNYYLAGIYGVVLISLGSLITAVFYTGTHGEGYSPLNHYISELGQYGVSQLAPVFNFSIILGCLLLTFFMVRLGIYIGGKFGNLFSVTGLIAGVSGTLVGVFSMNNMHYHLPVAFTFFRTALLCSILFSGYVLFVKQNKFKKVISIPGIITFLVSFAFVFISKAVPQAAKPLEVPTTARPEVWLDPLLEWGVFLSVLIWMLSVALYLKKNPKN